MAIDVPLIAGIYGPQGDMIWASWASETFTLNVTVACGRSLPAHIPVSFTIPVSANIALPPFGVQGGTQDLTIEIVAASGLVGERVFDSLSSIGSFTTTPSLHFSIPAAGRVSELIFSFLGEMAIRAGEFVELRLPDFLIPAGALATEASPNGTFGDGVWIQATERLRFYALSDVPGQTRVTLTVLSEAGARLPLLGVIANQSSIQISTNSYDGSVSGLPLSLTQPVGYFPISELRFANPRAGEVTAIAFRFQPNMQMANGDRISLLLPLFTGASVASFDVTATPAGRLVRASWDVGTTMLTLTVGGPNCAETVLLANEIFSVLVASSVRTSSTLNP